MEAPGIIKPLTSVRFFAAALIVLFHGSIQAGGPPGTTFGYDLGYAINPIQGVSFFFVLSGFILAYVYQSMPLYGPQVRAFFVSRIARLWPVHLTTLVLSIILIRGLPHDLSNWVKLASNAFLVQSNIPHAAWYFSYNGVSWSISTEFGFYIAFPLLLYIGRRFPVFLIIGTAYWLVGVLTYATVFNLGEAVFVSPLARVPEFALGVATYFLSARKPSGQNKRTLSGTGIELVSCCVVLCAMLLTAWLIRSVHIPHVYSSWLYLAGPCPAFAWFISIIARQRGGVSAFLSRPLMVHLGEASFALYMVHQMVLMLLFYHGRDVVAAHWWTALVLYWATCLLLASFLFLYVETPCRKLIRKKWALSEPVPLPQMQLEPAGRQVL